MCIRSNQRLNSTIETRLRDGALEHDVLLEDGGVVVGLQRRLRAAQHLDARRPLERQTIKGCVDVHLLAAMWLKRTLTTRTRALTCVETMTHEHN
jgi:hypothetical protein